MSTDGTIVPPDWYAITGGSCSSGGFDKPLNLIVKLKRTRWFAMRGHACHVIPRKFRIVLSLIKKIINSMGYDGTNNNTNHPP